MRMKRLIYFPAILVLISFLLLQCGGRKVNFKISGEFKIPMKGYATLGIMGLKDTKTVDSITIDEKGKFILKGYCNEPSLCQVRYENEKIYLVVKPKDKITISIDNSLPRHGYYIEGSLDSRLVQNIIVEQERVLDKITDISIAYEKSKEDPSTFEKNKVRFDSTYDNLLRKHKQFTEKFIRENPTSLACIFALYQNFGKTNQPLFDKFADINIFNLVDSNLTALYSTTPAVIALNRDVTEIKEQLNFKKFSDQLVRPGRKAPDFVVNTIDTNTIKLTDLYGNPVLYYFFASWNKVSAEEAIKLNSIFLKYKYSGLQVIGISFDTSPEKLKAFIDSNKIQFPVACDYGYWDSKYVTEFGVRFIPDVVLLDRNHIIYRRDIDPNELNLIFEEWRKYNMF
jgi:peroxiredoxin